MTEGEADQQRCSRCCSSVPQDVFNIDVEIRYPSSENWDATFASFIQSFTYGRNMFCCEGCGPNTVFSMLVYTGIPLDYLRTVAVPYVLDIARAAHGATVNIGCEHIYLKIEVNFNVLADDEAYEWVIIGDADEDESEVVEESLDAFSFKPATCSSIEDLKRFKWGDEEDLQPSKKRGRFLEGPSSSKECMICLDEFLDGNEVALMPCQHVYHDACIVKWLKASHLCPLCRYQMPS
ncbi:hypothetical protein ES332_A05G255200v1 [Gossypium tomentosum]|uniref:RING-type E3 ubiquitin transferase n=1 Tax=Gossypium tomentosum TaxID=34277 RepID=A0A5D2QK89_GOSTO|nr:hypothetical protein ES332_A05G255200v1 [Gossypium tomentosum]